MTHSALDYWSRGLQEASSLDIDFYKFHFKGIISPFNGLSVGPVSPEYLRGITAYCDQ